jgi:uncharacterized membrane protein
LTDDRRAASTDFSSRAKSANLIATISLIALIGLCLAWELRLAPIQAGGSWLVLKVLPLLAPLFGILRGRRYTHQWASLLILAYLTEGLVRVTTDAGMMRVMAGLETALATIFFVASVYFARITRPSARSTAAD